MLKKVLHKIISMAKAYVGKVGIIGTIINALEVLFVLGGVMLYLSGIVHRWWINRKFNKYFGCKPVSNECRYYYDPDERTAPAVKSKMIPIRVDKCYKDRLGFLHREDGYRMTVPEMEERYKNIDAAVDKYYTEEAIACRKLILQYEPKLFEGLAPLEQVKRAYYMNYNDLKRKYGLLQDQNLGVQQDVMNALQQSWSQPEENKVGQASVVPEDYAKTKKPPQLYFSPADYAWAQHYYGIENFDVTHPEKESLNRRLLYDRFKFDLKLVNTYICCMMEKDKSTWNKLMEKNNNDVAGFWRSAMAFCIDSDYAYNSIKDYVTSKIPELKDQIMGVSDAMSRIKRSNIHQEFDKMLSKAANAENEVRLNTPATTEPDEEEEEDPLDVDDDEDLDEYSDDLANFDAESYFPESEAGDALLDQLEALRSGEVDGFDYNSPEQTSEAPKEEVKEESSEDDEDPMKPVEMVHARPKVVSSVTPKHDYTVVTAVSEDLEGEDVEDAPEKKENEDHSPTSYSTDSNHCPVLKLPPEEYTIEKRALWILKLFYRTYKKLGYGYARNQLEDILFDEDDAGFKAYEPSREQFELRKKARAEGLPFKIFDSDYPDQAERKAAIQDIIKFHKEHGPQAFVAGISEITDEYRARFECETIISIIRNVGKLYIHHPSEIPDTDAQTAIMHAIYEINPDYTEIIRDNEKYLSTKVYGAIPYWKGGDDPICPAGTHRWIQC